MKTNYNIRQLTFFEILVCIASIDEINQLNKLNIMYSVSCLIS